MAENLYAPSGAKIVATKELVPGTCAITEGSASRLPDGTFDFDYDGGTDIDWNGQHTVTADTTLGGGVMARVFIDEDDEEWTEDKLVLGDPIMKGWAIFDADGSEQNKRGNCPLQLQYCHDEAVFEDDPAAHKHVVNHAKEGHEGCIEALQQLRDDSKPELAIVYWDYLDEGPGYEAALDVTDEDLNVLEARIFAKVITHG